MICLPREFVKAVRSARDAEPALDEEALLALVVDNTGLTNRLVRTALGYWASFPSEIDAQIDAAGDVESAAGSAWKRQRDLLAR